MADGFKIADAYIEITADTSKVGKDIDGKLGAAGTTGGGKFATMFGGSLGKIGALVGGAFAADKVVDFFSGAISEAREAEKVTAQTEAVIKSMGASTWITADGVDALATSISNKTGIDDEQIASAQNMLLTFGNVQNRLGEGNDVFDRATQSITDLSVATGKDMTSASTMVGKALNDPIAGISSLTRVGVQFTDQQKEQVKAMVEAGDTAGAQKIILGELEKQFGGSAAAQATSGDKLRTTWANFQEDIGSKLLPVLDTVFNFISGSFIPALSNMADWVSKNSSWLLPLIGVLGGLAGVIATVVAAVRIWTTVQAALNIVMSANPIGLIIIAVAALVAGFIYLWNNVEGFRNFFIAVWDGIKAAVSAVVNWFTGTAVPFFQAVWSAIQAGLSAIGNFFSSVWNGIKSVLSTVWGWIQAAVTAYFNAYKAVIMTVFNAVSSFISSVWNGIKAVISTVWNAISTVITGAINTVRNIITSVFNAVSGFISSVFNGIRNTISSIWNGIVGFISGVIGNIQGIINGLASIPGRVSGWFNQMRDGVSGAFNSVVSFVGGIPGRIVGALGDLGGTLLGAGKKVIDGFLKGIQNGFKAVKDKLSELTSFLPDWKGPAKRDSTILEDAGQLVIGGFVNGLESRFNLVKSTLGGLTNMVEGTTIGAPGVSGGALRASSSSLGGNAYGYGSGAPVIIQSVTIDASSVKDFNDVVEVFNNITTTARQGRGQ